MPVTRLYSIDDVRAMWDDRNRYETIDGELFVTPSPSWWHQAIAGRLHLALGTYVERHHLGWVWFAPLDVVLGPLTLVEPDLLFLRATRRAMLSERDVTGAPDLVIEILSPSTAHTDRGRKRALYQGQGVREYWVVDPEERRIEVWRPGALAADVHYDEVTWQPEPTLQPLRMDLVEIFRPL